MITITIGSEQRSFQDFTSQWVHQQLVRRRHDNATVCIKIVIDEAPLNMILSTPGCAATVQRAASHRPPNPQESQIYALWDRHGLNDHGFTGGQIIAFLQQLRRGT